jgi:hypothetical protein
LPSPEQIAARLQAWAGRDDERDDDHDDAQPGEAP